MSDTPILWEETVQGGANWSHVLKRGTALRLVDCEGGANVAALFYNFECPVERYNMPDTLKAQHIARLTEGFVLYSDMGRVLCSLTGDSVGWHDPLGGLSNAVTVLKQYGPGRYQECRNDSHKNALDGLLVELGKWGLGARDLVPNVNFFSRVDVGEDGGMSFHPNNSKAGDWVELRAEMNVLVLLNTCQHPLDPNPRYAPKPVELSIRRVPAPGPEDPCRISRPENDRGFTLTERYFL
ncbi:MAG: urea amidolyase associated protein UAAP1 [Candidatus Solibacter sp.]